MNFQTFLTNFLLEMLGYPYVVLHQDESYLELVSKELNHFGVIAGLFRQIGVIVVDVCYFALFEDFSQ